MEDEGELPQFFGQDGALHLVCRLFQPEEAGAGLAHFPEDGDELFGEPDVVPVVFVIVEFVRHGVHGPEHEDEPGAVVGDESGVAPGGPEHVVRQTGEGDDLDLLRGPVAELLEHGPFGVIGILLRHDEEELVLSVRRQSPEHAADVFGFSAARGAGH